MKLIKGYLIILIFASCSLSNKELKEGWWKYGEGYHIGNVLDFNKNYFLIKNDTIFVNNTAKALIISKKESVLGVTSRKISIQSLESDETGIYFQK